MENFDLVFLGSGPAGYAGALRAAGEGKRVLLVERGEVGGVCLNRGCIPTKSIISSLRVADNALRGGEFGLDIPSVGISFHQILQRKERVVLNSRKGVEALLKKRGVTTLHGRGELVGDGCLDVYNNDSGKTRYRAENIIICTGSTPATLPGITTDNISILNSDSLFDSGELSGRILIIGGGAIGCEYAYIFRQLGLSVTVVEAEAHLLPREDGDVAKCLEREFKKKRIKIITGDRVSNLCFQAGGVKVSFEKSGELEVDKVLVSVGRNPCSGGLGLDSAGVETDSRGGIRVNSRMETGVKGIYAAGDVTGSYQFAYTATHEALTAVDNINGNPREMNYNAVPRVIFSDPEVGCVGLSESDAQDKGYKVQTGVFHYRGLGRSHASGELAGLAKVVASEVDDKILGVHVVGANASDIIHSGCLMLMNRMTSREASDMLFAHPVFSEAVAEALWDVNGEALHKL